MKILVIGNGGREHAIIWKLLKDDWQSEIYAAPGNSGTAEIATNLPIPAEDIDKLAEWAKENKPDLTIVGPEVPLCLGLADRISALGLAVFGPAKAAARIEGSKAFAKEIMDAAKVPTARSKTVRTEEEARDAVKKFGIPVVLKADGLAAGKGVFVCMNAEELDAALQALYVDKAFGQAAADVVVEEFLEGEEASILAFVDGETIVPLASAQDHKRLLAGDKGPNTGGMGAYSPAPCVTPDLLTVVQARVLAPVVAELKARGIVYKGILYAGVMLTKNGPKVLEFNCRFGDPETQAILPCLKTSLAKIMLACDKGELAKCEVEWEPTSCVCIVMVSGGYPGKYEKGASINGLKNAAEIKNVVVFHAGAEYDGDRVVTSGGRVLGVTATGDTLEDAVRQAYQGVLKITFSNAYYRSDIAHRALNPA